MLLCKDCDYYQSFGNLLTKEGDSKSQDNKRGICRYSDFIFIDDPEDIEAEYPCNQMKINTYRIITLDKFK